MIRSSGKMDFVTLGGNLLGTIPLGDIVLYVTPLNLFLFAVMLVFTLLIAISKTVYVSKRIF